MEIPLFLYSNSKDFINFPKNMCFPESFEFETINKQKQPEKKQFQTSSSLVVFHTNDFSDLIDKSTSQG